MVLLSLVAGCGRASRTATGWQSSDDRLRLLSPAEGERLFAQATSEVPPLASALHFPGNRGLGPEGGTPIRHMWSAGGEGGYGVYVRDPDPGLFLELDIMTNVTRAMPLSVESYLNHDFASLNATHHWLLTQLPKRDGARASRNLYHVRITEDGPVLEGVAANVFYRCYWFRTGPESLWLVVPTGRTWAGINRERPVRVTLYRFEGEGLGAEAATAAARGSRSVAETVEIASWSGAAGWQPTLRYLDDSRLLWRLRGGRLETFLEWRENR